MRQFLLPVLLGIVIGAYAQNSEIYYNFSKDNGDRFLGYKTQFYNQGSYHEHDTIGVHFNMAGLPDTIWYTYLGSAEPWEERYVFRHDNAQLTTILSYSGPGTGKNPDDSITLEYHSSGLIALRNLYLHVDTFYLQRSEQYYRLPDGRDTLMTRTYYSALYNKFFQIRTRKSYNASGRLTEQLTSRDTGMGPFPTSRLTVAYPQPSDSIVTVALYNNDLQRWDTLTQVRHYLNASGAHDSMITLDYDTVAQMLVKREKVLYEYVNGKVSKEDWYAWNDSSQTWQYSGHVVYTYTASGDLKSRTNETLDSTGTFVPMARMEYEFNDNGDAILQTYYTSKMGGLTPLYRFLMFWKDPSAIAGGPEMPTFVKVYPVPASSAMQFELPKPYGRLTLRVFDMSGKKISEINGEGQHIKWYIPHRLEAGSYIYQLQTEGDLFSGKVVVGE